MGIVQRWTFLFFDRCFTFFVYPIERLGISVALYLLNFERKLSFDKMKGGVWIEIVGSFLFLFRFSLLQGFEK